MSHHSNRRFSRGLAVLVLVGSTAVLGACGGGGGDDGGSAERLDALNQRLDRLEAEIDELRDAAESLGATTEDG